MGEMAAPRAFANIPSPKACLELLKPITWFPPMWALACGVVSANSSQATPWWNIFLAVILAGPLLCGSSQVVNDWFDREVDAINEPNRPIPSGRVPGNWGLYLAIFWSALSMLVAWSLGPWVFYASLVGISLAWAYSAPPLRLKQNGWYGNAACGLCYEGLPWITGAAIMTQGGRPAEETLILALLYSIGAHGIMILNDFKSVGGDLELGIRSIPAQIGVGRAAKLACITMALPQIVVALLLWQWGCPMHAIGIATVLVIQIGLMARLLKRPKELAPWYNATGITLYVSGMMVSAFALSQLNP